jgi:4-hydroxybenzoate polyprenyltransferase
VWAVYFTLPANLLIYGVNDIFDYQTDLLNEKKHGYETLATPADRQKLWTAIAAANIPFLIILIPTASIRPWSVLAILGFVFFGIFYSAPPIRAKARPYLDSLFNILYLFPGLFGFLLLNHPSAIDWRLLAAASLWCMAMHAYSAVPDIKADQGANLRTIATSLGKNRTLWFCTFLYAGSVLLSAHVIGWLGYVLGTIYLILMGLSIRTTTDQQLFGYYKLFPWINTASGAAIFMFAVVMK